MSSFPDDSGAERERITPGGVPQVSGIAHLDPMREEERDVPNIDRAFPSDLADEPTEPPFPGT